MHYRSKRIKNIWRQNRRPNESLKSWIRRLWAIHTSPDFVYLPGLGYEWLLYKGDPARPDIQKG